MTTYADALARALAATDEVGLSDGTDRPATSADDVTDDAEVEVAGWPHHRGEDGDQLYRRRG